MWHAKLSSFCNISKKRSNPLVKPSKNEKKKSFFEKLKFSKKLFLDVKKINVFLKFTYFGKFGRYY